MSLPVMQQAIRVRRLYESSYQAQALGRQQDRKITTGGKYPLTPEGNMLGITKQHAMS